MSWSQAEAVKFARILESIAPTFGAHVALTGGCLYKDGEREDADFLFYRIRQHSRIFVVGLFAELANFGVKVTGDYGYVVKAEWEGKEIDFMFPDGQNGDEDYAPVAAANEFDLL